jgi:hypothetical protein
MAGRAEEKADRKGPVLMEGNGEQKNDRGLIPEREASCYQNRK